MINTNNTRDISNFGLNLYRIRTEQGLTREDLADKLGLSGPRIIYDYENGVKNPSLPKCVSIANVLGVSMDSLFRKE